MKKYPISPSFFPYSLFAPPVRNAKLAAWMGSFMRVPGRVFSARDVKVRRETIPGYEKAPLEVLVMEGEQAVGQSACMVYFHGGGFLFPAAGYHYDLCMRYAKEVPCKVVFVQYRLTPRHPFPIPAEDCYAALLWTCENARRLGIDGDRIGVGGDSAGGALAAAAAQMMRDRIGRTLRFQMLVYPVTDRRMNTPSNHRFTDTPMWNSKLSRKMWDAYVTEDPGCAAAYASPMEAENFRDLPEAYVETAEFDCLHDEGVLYAKALLNSGVPVDVHETKGTMHGFDIVKSAPETQEAVKKRIAFLKKVIL